ncbi:MAG: hypothetical protein LBB08_02110 [Rickettsiales bacterium]|nr:hypothetical protein [Rickettsiales bacterium]
MLFILFIAAAKSALVLSGAGSAGCDACFRIFVLACASWSFCRFLLSDSATYPGISFPESLARCTDFHALYARFQFQDFFVIHIRHFLQFRVKIIAEIGISDKRNIGHMLIDKYGVPVIKPDWFAVVFIKIYRPYADRPPVLIPKENNFCGLFRHLSLCLYANHYIINSQ